MGLVGWSHRPVRTLSRGLLQRCAVARVLLHEPAVLFLDEPFTGLDLDAQTILSDVLLEAHQRGTTLLMSTHDIQAGLALCTSALVLVRGRLAWHGRVRAHEREAFERRYRELTHVTEAGAGNTRVSDPPRES